MQVDTSCKIIEKTMLNDHAVSMTLEVGTMVSNTYKNAGQFVHIRCGDGLLLRRPISVCACTEDSPSNLLRIVFEARGEGTAWLASRSVGEYLDVLGLLGNGFTMTPNGRYILVGGGIGVPPMFGCAQMGEGRSSAVLGFRSVDRVMMADEFRAVCAEVLVATDDGTAGHYGFVDALVREILEKDKNFDGVLACGPKPMLNSVRRVAEAFGIPCQVSMEERMGCGVGACLVCTCDMENGTRKHVCKDGPIFDSKEVNWDV